MSTETIEQEAVEAAAAEPRADQLVRRLLFLPATVPEAGRGRRSDASSYRLFNLSMAVSGLRCLLGYVLIPIVLPAFGATWGGPAVGIPVSLVALGFDVMAMRRFWASNHPWRWRISYVYVAVMALVLVLLVRDLVQLAG
ncbi:MAG: hypothetical protein ACYDA2_04030 [Acidimicrobiales bacterium]